MSGFAERLYKYNSLDGSQLEVYILLSAMFTTKFERLGLQGDIVSMFAKLSHSDTAVLISRESLVAVCVTVEGRSQTIWTFELQHINGTYALLLMALIMTSIW